MKNENTTSTHFKASPLWGRFGGGFLALYIRFKGRESAKERAIKKAKKLHTDNGKHYRVYFLKNEYQVLTRQDIQFRKHTGAFGWQVNSTKMKPFCFYDTATDIVYPHLKTA